MARSSAALAAFQIDELETSEKELRRLIRRYPSLLMPARR